MEATHELATKTDKQLSVHEAVCAQRYEAIQKRFDDGSSRMKRIEYILYGIAIVTLLGPAHIAGLLKSVIVSG